MFVPSFTDISCKISTLQIITGGRTHGRTDGRTHGRTDARTDRWTDGHSFFNESRVRALAPGGAWIAHFIVLSRAELL